MQRAIAHVFLFPCLATLWTQAANLDAKGDHAENHWMIVPSQGLEDTENLSQGLEDAMNLIQALHTPNVTTKGTQNTRAHDSRLDVMLSAGMSKSFDAWQSGQEQASLLGKSTAWLLNTQSSTLSGRPFLIIFVSLVGLLLTVYIILRIIGVFVRAYLESSVFPELFGVDVHMSRLKILPFSFAISLDQVIVDNPKGYATEYLVKIKNMRCAVAPFTFIFTGFRKLHIMKLSIAEILVNVECKGEIHEDSNVQDIVNYLYYGKTDVHKGDEELASSGRVYLFHKVSVSGIQPSVTWRPRIMCCHTSTHAMQMNISVPDVEYEDMMTELEKETTSSEVATAMKFLMQVLLNKVLQASKAMATKELCGDGLRKYFTKQKKEKAKEESLPEPTKEPEDTSTAFFTPPEWLRLPDSVHSVIDPAVDGARSYIHPAVESARSFVDPAVDVSIKVVKMPVAAVMDFEVDV